MCALTKESEYLLLSFGRYFLENRKKGKSKFDSKQLGSAENIHQSIAQEISVPDIEDSCEELAKEGYLHLDGYFDGFDAQITDKTVIYIENKFKNDLSSVIDRIIKIKEIFF